MRLGKKVCRRVAKEVIQKHLRLLDEYTPPSAAGLLFPDTYDTAYDVLLLSNSAFYEDTQQRGRTQL